MDDLKKCAYSNLSRAILKAPFIIVTPPLSEISYEGNVLHMLAYLLNEQGENAFICHYPAEVSPIRSLPNYANLHELGDIPFNIYSKVLTQEVIEFFQKNGIKPIVIYAGSLENIFNLEFFVKYFVLDDLYLTHKDLKAASYNIFYSDELLSRKQESEKIENITSETLYFPVENLDFWQNQGRGDARKGFCYYLGDLNHDAPEAIKIIEGGGIKIEAASLSNHEYIRNIFNKSEYFYCFMDSPLILRAIMCGCPVILVPHDKFSGKIILPSELGSRGICLAGDGDGDGLLQAQRTVQEARLILSDLNQSASKRVKELANKLRHIAASNAEKIEINLINDIRLVIFDRKITKETKNSADRSSINSDEAGELPYVVLPASVIKDIARQVMFERELWSISFKIKKQLSSLFSKLYKKLK